MPLHTLPVDFVNIFLLLRGALVILLVIAHSVQNNGGSNISKRESSELLRAIFPNCAPVSLGEQRILVKQVFIY